MRLQWQIKESLIAYLEGLADFGMELQQVDREGGNFIYSAQSPALSEQQGTPVVGFAGVVRFTGHGGMLDLEFGSPRITRRAGRWVLAIVDSHDPEPLEFVEIGSFSAQEDGSIRGIGVSLTEEGTDLFFGPYTVGTPFDDVWVLDAPAEIAKVLIE